MATVLEWKLKTNTGHGRFTQPRCPQHPLSLGALGHLPEQQLPHSPSSTLQKHGSHRNATALLSTVTPQPLSRSLLQSAPGAGPAQDSETLG